MTKTQSSHVRSSLPIALLAIFASLISEPHAHAASSINEFVVPGGPLIMLQDGQQVDGHIIDMDQTNIVILTKEGAERRLPRATIGDLRFKTVLGDEIAGALLGWKSGVYELTAREAVVTVYSLAPTSATERHKDEEPGQPAPNEADSEGRIELVSPVNAAEAVTTDADGRLVELPLDDALDLERSAEAGELEDQVALAAPEADLEITVSANQAREGGDPITFDIELSRPSTSSVVLIYATIDESAIGGEDYETARGVLVIKAGETSARIEAPVIDDDLEEDDESLQLFLTVDPNVAVVRNRQISATITDNDR